MLSDVGYVESVKVSYEMREEGVHDHHRIQNRGPEKTHTSQGLVKTRGCVYYVGGMVILLGAWSIVEGHG